MSQGMEELTGGAVENIDFKDPKIDAKIKNKSLFDELLEYHDNDFLMGIVNGDVNGGPEAGSRHGLFKNHAYVSILTRGNVIVVLVFRCGEEYC